ncbi:MAG TPA: hypothetical protein VEP90_03070 [Methylomirabilota bacterium]|nr:hypothetical protein [Methylomirabilota bacterium]
MDLGMDIGGGCGCCSGGGHSSGDSCGHSAGGQSYGGSSYSSGKDAPCSCGYKGDGHTVTASDGHITHYNSAGQAHVSHNTDGSGWRAHVHDATKGGQDILIKKK